MSSVSPGSAGTATGQRLGDTGILYMHTGLLYYYITILLYSLGDTRIIIIQPDMSGGETKKLSGKIVDWELFV